MTETQGLVQQEGIDKFTKKFLDFIRSRTRDRFTAVSVLSEGQDLDSVVCPLSVALHNFTREEKLLTETNGIVGPQGWAPNWAQPRALAGSTVRFPTPFVSKHPILVTLLVASPVPFTTNAQKVHKVCRPFKGLHFMTQLLSQNPQSVTS
jgi:hypothetical protein